MSPPKILEIAAGRDVLGVIAEGAPESGAWVQASGTVESVQLRVANDQPTITFTGNLSLLSLTGPASGPLMATLARPDKKTDVALVGGELLRARSLGVTAALFTPQEASAAGSRAPRVPGAAPGASWAAIATATAEAEGASVEPEATEIPKFKDQVDHFKFGLCDVMLVQGDRMKIRDLTARGRLREISLKMLKVLPPTEHEGKRVFKLVRRD